ncbi:MAG: hypothetical protein MJ108_08310 [Saccharofermentans sp.]|nr:hypothetical protein [Saccharofermentans sp.]
MFGREDDNIRAVGGAKRAGKTIVYVICALIILITVLLDVYFILGIVG